MLAECGGVGFGVESNMTFGLEGVDELQLEVLEEESGQGLFG